MWFPLTVNTPVVAENAIVPFVFGVPSPQLIGAVNWAVGRAPLV